MDVYYIPKQTRDEVKNILERQPYHLETPTVNWSRLPSQLSTKNPFSVPYRGLAASRYYSQNSQGATSDWSLAIVNKSVALGSLVLHVNCCNQSISFWLLIFSLP